LKCRQLIELPEADEVSEFLAGLARDFDINSKLSTFVADTAVNIELMQQFFGQMLGAAESNSPSLPEPQFEPKAKKVAAWCLPELTILGTSSSELP
jgi:hypothetical protein